MCVIYYKAYPLLLEAPVWAAQLATIEWSLQWSSALKGAVRWQGEAWSSNYYPYYIKDFD